MQTTLVQDHRGRLFGAEIAAQADGSRGVTLATDDRSLFAVMYEARSPGAAVILASEQPFAPTFQALARGFARAGVTGLVLQIREGELTLGDLEAARNFLSLRGALRFGIAAEGNAAAEAISFGASRADVEAVAVFAPQQIARCAPERLGGRPLAVFCNAEDQAGRTLVRRGRAPCELLAFPGAGPVLAEVASDVAAMWVKRWIPLLCAPQLRA